MIDSQHLRRFTIAAMLAVTAGVVIASFWLVGRSQWDSFHAAQSRGRIDPYELAMAGDGDPARAPPELVAILGDSRLHHWNHVQFVSFASDNSLISRGEDRQLRFWEPSTGKQTHWLPAAGGVASSSNGTVLFLATSDGAIDIWDIATKSVRATLPGHPGAKSLRLSANDDGTLLASCAPDGKSFEWKLWDVNQEVERRCVTASGELQNLKLSGDGRLLATCGVSQVMIWDSETGEARHRLGPFLDSWGDSPCVVYALAFSPNGRTLITGDAGMRVRVWDTESGDELGKLPDHRSSIRFVTFGSRADQLVTGADTARFWRQSGPTKEWQPVAEVDRQTALNAVAFSPQGLIAVAGNDHVARLYDRGGQRIHRLVGGDIADVWCLAWSPDSDMIATGSRDGVVRLWDCSRWQVIRSWKGHTGAIHRLAFGPDGHSIASSSADGTVAIWDTATGQERHTLSGYVGPATPLAFSPDGQILATRGTGTGKASIQLWQAGTAQATRTFQQERGRLRGDIAFSPDGRLIAMGDTFNTVTLWDVGTGSIRTKLGEASGHDVAVAISPDGRFVAAGSRDRSVKVWDLADGSLAQSLKGHGSLVRSVAFSPDSQFLASSADDGSVRLWLTSTGEELKVLQLGPTGGMIHQVAFSPDGKFLAVANGNGTAYVLRSSVP